MAAKARFSPDLETLWNELHTRHSFDAHEDALLTHSLRWWTRADRYMAAADDAEDAEQARLEKSASTAATTGLKFWARLKFLPAEDIARRPGRPSGDEWSAQRRRNAGRVA